MQGLRAVGGCLAAGFLLFNCGRSSASDSPDLSSHGGAGGDATECAGGAPEGGCNAAGGVPALAEYARLRPACSLNVLINRRGKPVCVDEHIK